jgi:hypothetical protein
MEAPKQKEEKREILKPGEREGMPPSTIRILFLAKAGTGTGRMRGQSTGRVRRGLSTVGSSKNLPVDRILAKVKKYSK